MNLNRVRSVAPFMFGHIKKRLQHGGSFVAASAAETGHIGKHRSKPYQHGTGGQMSNAIERLKQIITNCEQPDILFFTELGEVTAQIAADYAQLEQYAEKMRLLAESHKKDYQTQAQLVNERTAENADLKQRVKQLENDFLDAVDCKTGIGPTALSTLIAERDSLKRQVEELKTENRRLVEENTAYSESENGMADWMNKNNITYDYYFTDGLSKILDERDQLKAKLDEARKLIDYAEHQVLCRLHKSRDLEELDSYLDTGVDNRKCTCGLQELIDAQEPNHE